MMLTLWIAIHVPDLALQSATRGLLPQLPVAITETSGNRTLIHQANRPAQDAGVRTNMTAAAAQAYASGLVLLPRDVDKETEALTKIATSALQYTPYASMVRSSVLLDVTTSLNLFGGLGQLCGLLRHDLRELGYHGVLGVAPTPLAAELLALCAADGRESRACTSFEQLPERLRPIPASLLPWDDTIRATLATLGLRTLGQLYDAPRDGLLRRFGFACVEDLDRIAGIYPDPRTPLALPEQFHSTYDFAAEIEDVAIHLLAIERLLVDAKGFLGARGAAAPSIQLTLRHGRKFTTKHEVRSSLPQRDVQQWLLLVREQLQRTPLPGPVTAIHLAIDELVEYVPPSNGLPGCLPDSNAQAEDRLRLLDRLAARLGKARVFTLATRDEHRPEEAWTNSSAGNTSGAGARCDGIKTTAAQPPAGRNVSVVSRPLASLHLKPRPIWLLDRPRALIMRDGDPVHHGPLTMISGPERIQSGWWDNKPVDRDYFVARNSLGETCWIYRELGGEARRWYLHGVFG